MGRVRRSGGRSVKGGGGKRTIGDSVWPGGKGTRLVNRGTQGRTRFDSPSDQKLRITAGLVILPPAGSDTLKWLNPLPISVQSILAAWRKGNFAPKFPPPALPVTTPNFRWILVPASTSPESVPVPLPSNNN